VSRSEKTDDLVVVNRHVVAGFRSPTKVYIYDFYVNTTAPYLSRRVIDDLAASAIYHTNIGGLVGPGMGQLGCYVWTSRQ